MINRLVTEALQLETLGYPLQCRGRGPIVHEELKIEGNPKKIIAEVCGALPSN